MSTDPSSAVASSVLTFVQTGAYPDDEQTVSTTLTSTNIPSILELVSKAEEDVKAEIRTLSSSSAPSIDTWLTQATALQTSIAHSRSSARAIVEAAEHAKSLGARVHDAAGKVALLQRELEFSVGLEGVLDTLQVAAGLVDGARNALDGQELGGALEKVLNAEMVVGGLRRDGAGIGESRAVAVLGRRVGSVREGVVKEVLGVWGRLVNVDGGRVVVKREDSEAMDLETVIEALGTLGVRDGCVSRLHRELDSSVLGPRMNRSKGKNFWRVEKGEGEIRLVKSEQEGSVLDMIDDIYAIVNFISTALPRSISAQLLDTILPSLILQLVSNWLDPAMPLKLTNLETFKEITTKVEELSLFISKSEVDMPSDADLAVWLKKIPQTWLAKRKEVALADMREMCYQNIKRQKMAERIETQLVSSDDVMYADPSEQPLEEETPENGTNDEWDAGWGEEEEPQGNEAVEEEDTSAWDDEPAAEETSKGPKAEEKTQEDEEAGAWGWGDDGDEADEAEKSPAKPAAISKSPSKAKANGKAHKQQPTTKEITLRENYTVTSIPDGIIDLINQIISDASTLSSPDFPVPTIAPATLGLSTIPTLLLAMYRATASTYYTSEPAGNMLIYNDSVHLHSQLSTLLSRLSTTHPLSKRLRTFDSDIAALLPYSRRAYGREMDSQRTILSDILSSTSGFINCTAPLNAAQYSAIIQDAINRVRDVDRSWTNILSNSDRLQSLGSLVGTLLKQMSSDVLERADDPSGISEEQSKMLKSFCDNVAGLSDLFDSPTNDGEEETSNLVHVYTPDWFRFRYLGEILEASLADIKYLWTEGELSLEFSADEVVDLVQALFADSSHRKEAIRVIKRA
ncbi:hypothetical protein BT63DRAFT_438913 [Microthyrium microscopicum]|uniref:ZW10 C-terminal helical domain-containing protein n=1 Tax=Microthyrium microscopicum TaxID=703497 RepID=A0A6A6UGT9_9PEZI|nr:hypothetical protein BT63DRAFT_438913 [Microthyrium microscopicum]